MTIVMLCYSHTGVRAHRGVFCYQLCSLVGVKEHVWMAAGSDSLSVIHYWRRQSIQFICTSLPSAVELENMTIKRHNVFDSVGTIFNLRGEKEISNMSLMVKHHIKSK